MIATGARTNDGMDERMDEPLTNTRSSNPLLNTAANTPNGTPIMVTRKRAARHNWSDCGTAFFIR
jgi:hypothetical protein